MSISIIWLNGSRYVPLSSLVVWGSAMWQFLTRLYWGSGFGDMLLNQCPYGVGLLIANMVANGGGWCSNHSRESYGISLWNHICKGWSCFSQYIGFKVGDGSCIKFWSDSWCGDQLLRDRFSILFHLARNQEATVADYLHFHGTIPIWDVEFLRPAQDWELDVVDSFMGFLYSVPTRPGKMDSIFWNLSSHASFEVSSFYSALSQLATSHFPWRLVWKAKVPSRVAFFIWTASLGKILTTDNLRRHRVIILDWCCLCKADGESVNHLFLHCLVARDLWNLVCSLFGVS